MTESSQPGDKLPIKMLNDRILVKMDVAEGERRTSGGIVSRRSATMWRAHHDAGGAERPTRGAAHEFGRSHGKRTPQPVAHAITPDPVIASYWPNFPYKKVSRIYDVFDRAAIQELVDEHLEGRKNRRLLIWSLLSVEEFMKGFMPS